MCLHNFVIDEEGGVGHLADYGEAENGAWRSVVQAPLNSISLRPYRNATAPEEMRQTLVEYFNNEGAVSFQNEMILRGNF